MRRLLIQLVRLALIVLALSSFSIVSPRVASCGPDDCDVRCPCTRNGNAWCSGVGCFESGCEQRWLGAPVP